MLNIVPKSGIRLVVVPSLAPSVRTLASPSFPYSIGQGGQIAFNGDFFLKMNWRSTAGKSALAKMLMKEHGFSKRPK